MKDLYIDQIREGDSIHLSAAVQGREYRVTATDKPMLSMTLADRTGTIAAVCWGATKYDVDVNPGDVVYVEGGVGVFNDALQINVNVGPVLEGSYDLSDLAPSTRYNVGQLYETLLKYVDQLQDEHLGRFLRAVVTDEEIAPRLQQWPAGMKLHHAFLGGLLEHVLSMVKASWLLCNHYKRLNRGLLVAGCIFHDLAKIEELSVGVTFGYTKLGTLHGHIALGYSLIDRLSQKYVLDPEVKLQLQHLVLSHHDLLEHGAAKRPMTAEAIVLSLVDVMDARLEQFFRLTDAASGDEFTAYIPSLERVLYCGYRTAEAETVTA